jgi:hypothetical protein
MKINFVLLFVFAGLFIACNRNISVSDEAQADESHVQIKNDTISNIYAQYIRLKDALVKSDTASAGKAATDLSAALNVIKGCESSTTTAREIGSSNDIKEQRLKFLKLSSDIIPMVKNTKLTSGSIFVLYCPMANQGNGGYWLSSSKEVQNPYYGDEMLDCGEVKEEIH